MGRGKDKGNTKSRQPGGRAGWTGHAMYPAGRGRVKGNTGN